MHLKATATALAAFVAACYAQDLTTVAPIETQIPTEIIPTQIETQILTQIVSTALPTGSGGIFPQEVPVNFIDGTCDDTKKAKIRREMTFAHNMALRAQESLTEGDYYGHFFSDGLKANPAFEGEIRETYRLIADMLSGRSPDYAFSVSCDQGRDVCWKRKMVAAMNDDLQIMFFCDPFFVPDPPVTGTPAIADTQNVLGRCPSIDLRDAQRSRSAIIIHEASHTTYAMRGNPPAIDVAYGYTTCTQLPRNQFDRSCVPYGARRKKRDGTLTPAVCPTATGDEGICDPALSAQNADTYAHVAAGIFFSKECNRAIPHPQGTAADPNPNQGGGSSPDPNNPGGSGGGGTSPDPNQGGSSGGGSGNTGSSVTKRHPHQKPPLASPRQFTPPHTPQILARDISCPFINDAYVWDGPLDEGEGHIGILGYAHFGDSYASGMGTGTTSTDKCRVGSNNYGDLLYRHFNNPAIPYDRRSCSGDTTSGLYDKIAEWDPNKAANTTVVTLTMGGNDLGFSDLVWYCVITPNTALWGGRRDRRNCVETEQKARDHMNDMSENGLKARLKEGYLQVLRKTGRKDTHLYVAGYPTFFNEETDDCKDSSFHYWWGGYKPPSDWPLNRIVYLTKSLRTELDDLVRQLNDVIVGAIGDANKEFGGNNVHWVDVDRAFKADVGHRWCEEGVHEPDESRQDTWFFLSAWKDVDGGQQQAAEEAEIRDLVAKGSIQLPGPEVCGAANRDPYDAAMCRVADTVREWPVGEEARRLRRANEAIRNGGNLTSQDVAGYLPTRQIKTFHPRTPGMLAYMNAILTELEENGQL